MATLIPAIGTPADTLHAELRTVIANSRQRLAGAVNAELTRLYWNVGQRLRTEVLGGADRAKYGDQLIKRVGEQLAQEFGLGFEAKNLRRMLQFAVAFPDTDAASASGLNQRSPRLFLQNLKEAGQFVPRVKTRCNGSGNGLDFIYWNDDLG